jgi:ribosomal-protein-alanine N-acetyltransferase
MTGPLLLEAATTDDLDALVALEMECHAHPWSARGLRDALARGAGGRGILVLRGPWTPDDARRGIRAYCALEQVADELHVHNLAVAPEARRRGLARRLLALALEIAARNGARAAHLEVRESNAAARALYRAMGFAEEGRRRDYYSSPTEDAILLTRRGARPEP